MEVIKIESTPKTPMVHFDQERGHIELRGRSIPENSLEFYKELLEWLEEYGNNPQAKTNVEVQLEYFNTSSSKCLMDLLKRIEASTDEACINWYYEEEDEDMLEAGEDYDAIIDLPFKLIATEIR